jgi:hypothetical protein
MAKGTEVAVAAPQDEAQLPAYLQGYGNVKNDDNFDSSDVVLPRIKLLQGISGEVETFDDAKAGRFWHTGLDISLGESFRFVVADRRKKYLLSAPIEDGQGVLARADDAVKWDRLGKWDVKIKGVKGTVTWEITDLDVGASGLTQWGTYNPNDEDSPPAATLFYDYLVFLPDYPDLGPAVLSLARSQIKTAKKGLNDKIKLHQTNGRPMQALVFEATSKTETSDGQDFKNFVFRGAGFVQDEALFKLALEHKNALADVKIADEGDTGQVDRTTDDGKGEF